MTTPVDIANRALQLVGIPKVISSLAQDSIEAQTCNLIINKLRDELNRMAPWACTEKFVDLTYITSLPGTPENPAAGPALWQPGVPAPPWSYEYQYPVDCIRAKYIMPQYTNMAGGVPIYPLGTTTGIGQIGWTGPALKFKVSTDLFFSATLATTVSAGAGYAVGDLITFSQPSFTFTQGGVPFTMPVGAPAITKVGAIGAGGAITSNTLVSIVPDVAPPNTTSGSYFSSPANPVGQGSTTGSGSGATFNLTMGPQLQRVILCNQEAAILCYNTQVVDPNVMDQLFQDAWIHILAARLGFQLTGDKALANGLITLTNGMISEARKADGNEELTVNDVTPDFIRIRGNYGGPNWEYSPNFSFDWGSFYAPY